MKWKDIVAAFSDEFQLAFDEDCEHDVAEHPEKQLATGLLTVSNSKKKFNVTLEAYSDGIRISRYPFGFLHGRAMLAWSSIQSIHEYRSVITDKFPYQSEATVFLKPGTFDKATMPWNNNFNSFLHESVGYVDRR